ncbi:hypothetical protein D3C76_973260 [compost metagenome]
MRKKSKVMTKVIAGSLLMTCSLIAAGCSTEYDEVAAIKVGESLKSLQYQIQVRNIEMDIEDVLKEQEATLKNHDQYKPFLTEQGYNEFIDNKQYAIATGYALKHKLNMEIKNIQFENMNPEHIEKDTFSFRYNIDIELSPSELTSSRGKSLITKTGQMTVVKEDEVWKVLKDQDSGFLADE